MSRSAKTIQAEWYDYPQYFDMLFRDETKYEVDFFELAFERYAERKVTRVFEPGCGSGRLVVAMAALGYEVTGLDLSDAMLDYLRRKLRRRGLTAQCIKGDMALLQRDALGDAGPVKPFDAAFCTYNTFRHLTSEKLAVAHLKGIAELLKPGGLYILGMHLTPEEEYEAVVERFVIRAAGTKLTTTIRVPHTDLKKRLETLKVNLRATQRSGKIVRIESQFPLRLYTPTQLRRLFKKLESEFELVESFDFSYDIDEPCEFDSDLMEGVFILRKR
ncbi:MAG: class I SAM-dependent methyltransferase [Planctomycetota bacterium]